MARQSSLNAGDLNQFITIRSKGEGVSDGMGGETDGTPTNLYIDVPASIRVLSGAEQRILESLKHKKQYMVKFWFLSSITTHEEVVWNDTVYEIIEAYDPYNNERELHLVIAEQ